MKKEITKEYLQSLFDYKDGDLFWKVKRNGCILGSAAGVKNKAGYKIIGIDGKLYRAHRLVFMYHSGYLPNIVDHIDGNIENNKFENLRAATVSENLCNSKKMTNNTSGIKGVCWFKPKQKWRVRINLNSKENHIGYFDDIELAELVAIEARNKFHKSFARHK